MNKQQAEQIDKAIYILSTTGNKVTNGNIAKLTGIARRTVGRYPPPETPIPTGLPTIGTTYSTSVWCPVSGQVSKTELLLGSNGLNISGGLLLPEQILPLMVSLLNGLIAKDILLSSTEPKVVSSISSAVLSCLRDVCNRGSIHSHSRHFHYLHGHGWKYIFYLLFERYDKYVNGARCFKYRLTSLGEDYIRVICVAIGSADMVRVVPSTNSFMLPKSSLPMIRPRDMFRLLSDCIGSHGDYYVISNEVLDRQFSRKYSLITSIGSATRDTNYIGYDISACLQSIITQSIDLPLKQHGKYLSDKANVRLKLMKKLGLTYAKVKEMISAIDNGKKYDKRCKKSKWLRKYRDETELMTDTYNEYIESKYPLIYQRAYDMAKNDKKGVKKKYSILFFCWTQVEREIRDSMISFAKATVGVEFVHECHDAIYIDKKYDKLDIPALEKHIKATTGFDITID